MWSSFFFPVYIIIHLVCHTVPFHANSVLCCVMSHQILSHVMTMYSDLVFFIDS